MTMSHTYDGMVSTVQIISVEDERAAQRQLQVLGVCYIDAIGWHSNRWIYLIGSYRTKPFMCKFDDILNWECWGTKQAKEGKLGLRNTKTGWFKVKKDKYTPKRRYLENQISQHGNCLCLVIQSCRGQEYAS